MSTVYIQHSQHLFRRLAMIKDAQETDNIIYHWGKELEIGVRVTFHPDLL